MQKGDNSIIARTVLGGLKRSFRPLPKIYICVRISKIDIICVRADEEHNAERASMAIHIYTHSTTNTVRWNFDEIF